MIDTKFLDRVEFLASMIVTACEGMGNIPKWRTLTEAALDQAETRLLAVLDAVRYARAMLQSRREAA